MTNKSTSNGIGLGGILVIIFTMAKLTGNFDYSWWWVFAPCWLPLSIVLGAIGIAYLFAGIIFLILWLVE